MDRGLSQDIKASVSMSMSFVVSASKRSVASFANSETPIERDVGCDSAIDLAGSLVAASSCRLCNCNGLNPNTVLGDDVPLALSADILLDVRSVTAPGCSRSVTAPGCPPAPPQAPGPAHSVMIIFHDRAARECMDNGQTHSILFMDTHIQRFCLDVHDEVKYPNSSVMCVRPDKYITLV